MRKSVLTIAAHPSERGERVAAKFGYAATVMRHSPLHFKYPMSYFATLIEPALLHDQIKFYFNLRGEPVGFVIWAYLAPDVEERFLRTGNWDLHISEWNEGSSFWIVDFAAPFGHAFSIIRDLKNSVLSSQRVIRYFRLKKGIVIAKEVTV
jgi:cytolysin-activating lysine-acyltransferase